MRYEDTKLTQCGTQMKCTTFYFVIIELKSLAIMLVDSKQHLVTSSYREEGFSNFMESLQSVEEPLLLFRETTSVCGVFFSKFNTFHLPNCNKTRIYANTQSELDH